MYVTHISKLQSSTQTNRLDYPSYELYTETLRAGAFKPVPHSTTASAPPSGWEGKQLRLIVNKGRKVQEVIKI
jgi:D-glycerate 3-kinase